MAQRGTQSPSAHSRILALDYLRGFFIIVIIVDHLWRWPNIFQYISGRGELWASAAEGFVIISGLLVGYIRGYKNRGQPLRTVTKKLITRGVMLYIWMIVTTILLVAASWVFYFQGAIAHVPIPMHDWGLLITSALRFDYVHTLTHFLYLYAIFLVLSPIAIWLFRQGQAWLVMGVSIAMWMIGVKLHIEWLQWQLLFFIPASAGYYLESLTTFYTRLARPLRLAIPISFAVITVGSMLIAAAIILPTEPGSYENTLFGRDPITIATIVTSFVWFGGLLSIFQLSLPYLQRWAGWLLGAFGERSLTAYILHTIPLLLCQLLFIQFDNFWLNSLLAASCVLFTWGLLKIPGINKVIPR